MKKILIPLSALLVSGLAHAQLAPAENYVYTKTYLDYNTTNGQPTKTSETVQYFDGLGRPKQVVNIKASPQGKDVVTPILYDEFGRQLRDYLPVPQQSTANGGIYSQTSGNFPVGDPTGVYINERAFSEKVLENSPLDRILQQKQVGNAWNDKPVQFDYDVNTLPDAVKKYVTVTSWEYESTKSTISQSTNFDDAQLYKNTVTDEDGNQTIEFKNGRGQVLLVRKILSVTEKADTYYVYNEYNQLAFVIPPLASVIQSLSSSDLENLCYQYKYDGRGRLVEKRIPGKGWEYMVYDKQNRLAMTQDANIGASKQWLFTKYDKFGRVAYTGIYTSPANYDSSGRAIEQANVDAKGSNNVARTSMVGFTNNGMDVYYDNTAANNFPNIITTLLSINYYDNYYDIRYGFNPDVSQAILETPLLSDNPDQDGKSTKSLLVMSLIKNIEDDNWTKNYVYYDKRGRVVGNYSINHLGGRTEVASKLDFAGVVQQSITRHKRLDTDTDRVITENFTYDPQNRLLTHTHQVDSNPVEYLAQNSYNELSQLSGKKVGGISPSTPLQDISYSYNIRGWMTKINDPANLNGKLFGYEIKYNNPENPSIAPARFNGNIAEIDWMTGTFPNGTKRRYSYQYDGLNRLLQGVYSEPGSSVTSNNYYNEILSYDINGNISTLKRFSAPSTGGTTAEKIDDLIYNYTGNRLDMITLPTGVVNNPSGYNALQNTISYDLNGNMTIHPDKGIVGITYNYLNLPSVVTNSSGRSSYKINYLYRADGTKIRKSLNAFVQSKTDYLDGFQYLTSGSDVLCVGCPPPSPELQFVPTSEGYYDFVKNKYIYNYIDHLGNTRLSYFHNGSSIEVLEENNYYPFGLKHEGYNALAGNSTYKYKYNGKELQETGMYDYGARMYMPDIGRWGVVDPLSELQFAYSSYSYVYGNPIRFNDPTGMIGKEGEPKLDPNARGGDNNPALIQEVVMTRTKPSSLSFMGINNIDAYHASQDRLASAIRGSKAALATEKFEKNLGFAMITFGMGGSNLLASAGWVTFDSYMSYQDEETQGAVASVQLMALAIQLRHGNLSKVSSILDVLAAEKGIVISNGVTKKGVLKVDYLFRDVNDAKNFGAKALGSSKTRIYDGSGKWIGWENKVGDQVYWGHGDWGKGVGSSTFPHLNYNINGQKGHLFLENKINNRGQASEFMSYFNLGK